MPITMFPKTLRKNFFRCLFRPWWAALIFLCLGMNLTATANGLSHLDLPPRPIIETLVSAEISEADY